MRLDLHSLQNLEYLIADIIGYETDTSCGDPDCCGGPYYEYEDLVENVKTLKETYGIEYENN